MPIMILSKQTKSKRHHNYFISSLLSRTQTFPQLSKIWPIFNSQSQNITGHLSCKILFPIHWCNTRLSIFLNPHTRISSRMNIILYTSLLIIRPPPPPTKKKLIALEHKSFCVSGHKFCFAYRLLGNLVCITCSFQKIPLLKSISVWFFS